MSSIGQLYHWKVGHDLSLLKEERKFVKLFIYLFIPMLARVAEYSLLTLHLATCVFVCRHGGWGGVECPPERPFKCS